MTEMPLHTVEKKARGGRGREGRGEGKKGDGKGMERGRACGKTRKNDRKTEKRSGHNSFF